MSSQAYCRQITKKASSSFYLASKFFPQDLRRDIWALYAFCRSSDDIVDEATDKAAAAREMQRRHNILKKRDYASDELLWPEFFRAVDQHSIDLSYAHDLLEGLESDLHFQQPRNLAELERYCYQVAGTVGGMCTQSFGVRELPIIDKAISLGVAMQLTNIIRDVREDLQSGRIYLPADLMRRHAVTPAQLGLKPTPVNVRTLLGELAAVAFDKYEQAKPAIALLPPEAQRPVYAAYLLYSGILETARAHDFDITQRQRLNYFQKLKIVLTAYRHNPANKVN